MKRMKRIVSLLLALMTVCSMAVFSAGAAEEELPTVVSVKVDLAGWPGMYGGTVAVVYAYDADGNDIFSKVDWSITDEEGQEPSEVYILNKGVWVDPDAKPGYYTLKGTGRDGRALGEAYTTFPVLQGSGGYISREKHAITAKAGVGGSISPNGTRSITNGNNQNYTITANNGYKIADVLVDGKSIGAVASYKFVKVQTAHTSEARFATAPMKDPDTGFSDIAKSDYFYDAVKWAVGSKVTSGLTETTFGPQETCTRAQAVTFLWRAAGSPQTNSVDNPFTDVKRSDYYYQAVLWAVANNVTNGVSATSFDPNVTVQRDQVVTFLWRASGKPAAKADLAFSDLADGAFYADAVQWAVAHGITTGTSSTTFTPAGGCTRAQIVTFLYRSKN